MGIRRWQGPLNWLLMLLVGVPILVGVVFLVPRRSVERRPETRARRLRLRSTRLTILEKSNA